MKDPVHVSGVVPADCGLIAGLSSLRKVQRGKATTVRRGAGCRGIAAPAGAVPNAWRLSAPWWASGGGDCPARRALQTVWVVRAP